MSQNLSPVPRKKFWDKDVPLAYRLYLFSFFVYSDNFPRRAAQKKLSPQAYEKRLLKAFVRHIDLKEKQDGETALSQMIVSQYYAQVAMILENLYQRQTPVSDLKEMLNLPDKTPFYANVFSQKPARVRSLAQKKTDDERDHLNQTLQRILPALDYLRWIRNQNRFDLAFDERKENLEKKSDTEWNGLFKTQEKKEQQKPLQSLSTVLKNEVITQKKSALSQTSTAHSDQKASCSCPPMDDKKHTQQLKQKHFSFFNQIRGGRENR